MADEPDPNERQVKPFSAFLVEQRKGQAHAEMSSAFNELVEAVQATGKAGSVTLKIKVTPTAKQDSDAVTVSDEVKLSLPQPERGASLFFIDSHHNLQRNDPRQPELPMHAVDGGRDDEAAEAAEGTTGS